MAYAAVLLAVLVAGSDEDGCSRFNFTDCDIEFIENACPIMCDVDTDKEETSFAVRSSRDPLSKKHFCQLVLYGKEHTLILKSYFRTKSKELLL